MIQTNMKANIMTHIKLAMANTPTEALTAYTTEDADKDVRNKSRKKMKKLLACT